VLLLLLMMLMMFGDAHNLFIKQNSAVVGTGERQIPWKSQSVDIKALGAKGDGKTDDTWALQKAVDNAQPGTAIFFPPGKYVITKQLDIRKAVVLRGAGKYKTTLYFPKSLADVYGRHGGWGHGTCFINFWGW
jgi:polygalacturonase